MNEPQTLPDCDHQRAKAFLSSDNYRLEDEQLLAHLETCSACRDFMETHAASAEMWKHASTFLKPGEFDEAGAVEYSAATIGGPGRLQPVAIQDVLDALAPTDDPHKLGRLGHYEVTGVVGVGGMGVVLKAIDPSLDRVVAVKVMAPALANNEKARQRFAREAKAAAAVLHPNVVPIHSVASGDSMPYLVMSYIRGGSLQKRLEREGPLPDVEVLRIGSQIAAGLAAAHDQGLVHRDIKPENILLEEGVERVTITDFGLARAVDDNTVTQNGTIAGTPMYMSPEQARGEKVDQQSDLFSLGSVLYALCTGRPPFRGDTSYGVMRQIIDEQPMAVREVNPDVPEWLAVVIEKLMSKDKALRIGSANEVHKLLEACLSHVQQPDEATIPEILRVRPRQETASEQNIPQQSAGTASDGGWQGGRIKVWMSVLLCGGIAGLLVLAGTGQLATLMNWQADETPKSAPPVAAAAGGAEDSAEAVIDKAKLQGRWQVTYLEEGGTAVPDALAAELRHVFAGDTLSMFAGEQEMKAPFRIDPSTSPKSIDIIQEGEIQRGIYELQGETLRLCLSTDDKPRPRTFQSKSAIGRNAMLLLTRIGNKATGLPWQSYSKDNLTLKDVVMDKKGNLEVSFRVMAETMYSCPGASGRRTDKGLELSFVRLRLNQNTKIEFPASPSGTRGGQQVTVAPRNQPVFVRFGEELVKIWDPVEQDRKMIQGTWQVTYSEDSGRVTPQEQLKGLQFAFSETAMTVLMAGREVESTYTLDASTSPRSIDITENGRLQKGIYDLQGGTLRISIAEDTEERPTAFDSQPDSANDVVILLKRVDPGKAAVKVDRSGPLTVDLARDLLPEAASISNADFTKLSRMPQWASIKSQSLSLVIMTLEPLNPDGTPAADMQFLTEGTPKPSDLANAMWLSQGKGYASIIQPEYISECRLDAADADGRVRGVVRFNAPQLYVGVVNFEARRHDGKWRVEKFTLPVRGISVVLGKDGNWQRLKGEAAAE